MNHIARELNIPQRTVSRHLIEAQLSRKKDIEPRDEDPPQRYEHEARGDMIDLGNYILFDTFFQKNYIASFIHRT